MRARMCEWQHERTHTRTHAHTRARAHTHTHTHTQRVDPDPTMLIKDETAECGSQKQAPILDTNHSKFREYQV